MTPSDEIGWSGTALERLPNESSASSLLWLAWRNAVHASDIRWLCTGQRWGCRDHTFLRLGWMDSARIVAETGWELPSKGERTILELLKPVTRGWLSDLFRFCPICLEAGYHSFWYQFQPLACCPVHNVPLAVDCSQCGATVGRYAICNEIFSKPYRCMTCNAPLFGAPLDRDNHVLLRRHASEFERAFSELNQWALEERLNWRVVSEFESQNHDLIQRNLIGVPLVCGVARALCALPVSCSLFSIGCPVRALTWSLLLASGSPNWESRRLSWEERVRTAMPVYRFALRNLQQWIGRKMRSLSTQSDVPTIPTVEQILDASTFIAAYSLLRRRVEEHWFGLHDAVVDARIVEPPIPLATGTRRCQRLMCAAVYLGMYVDCVCTVQDARHHGTDPRPVFDLRSGLEVFVMRRQRGEYVTGAVIFPDVFSASDGIWARASNFPAALARIYADSNETYLRARELTRGSQT